VRANPSVGRPLRALRALGRAGACAGKRRALLPGLRRARCRPRQAVRSRPRPRSPDGASRTVRKQAQNRPSGGRHCIAEQGKGGNQAPPKRGLSGPFLAPPRPGRPWPALAACGLAHRVPLARATGPVKGPLRPGKAPDTTPPVPRVSWRLLRSARWPVRGPSWPRQRRVRRIARSS
jgi:hypothetical protein